MQEWLKNSIDEENTLTSVKEYEQYLRFINYIESDKRIYSCISKEDRLLCVLNIFVNDERHSVTAVADVTRAFGFSLGLFYEGDEFCFDEVEASGCAPIKKLNELLNL